MTPKSPNADLKSPSGESSQNRYSSPVKYADSENLLIHIRTTGRPNGRITDTAREPDEERKLNGGDCSRHEPPLTQVSVLTGNLSGNFAICHYDNTGGSRESRPDYWRFSFSSAIQPENEQGIMNLRTGKSIGETGNCSALTGKGIP